MITFFKISGLVLCSLIVVIIVYLATVIFSPLLSVAKQPLQKVRKKDGIQTPACRKDIHFKVGDTQLSGWLYLPEDLSTPPGCVIMGHGFGGTKDALLEPYALRFVEAGIAVITFDYRHFGESRGEPRQLFSPARQIEDHRAAIAYARSLKETDPDKIAIWGTSASSGYGLILAAQDKKIACVISQTPGLDEDEEGKMMLEREGLGFILQLIMHAQRDKGRTRFGLTPHKIPMVGKPGTFAILTAPGVFEGYSRLVASKNFVNEVCARIMFDGDQYNPMDYVNDVKCPVLLLVCEKDNLVSENSYARAVKILDEYAVVKKYPVDHFGLYAGEYFEKSIKEQISFLNENL